MLYQSRGQRASRTVPADAQIHIGVHFCAHAMFTNKPHGIMRKYMHKTCHAQTFCSSMGASRSRRTIFLLSVVAHTCLYSSVASWALPKAWVSAHVCACVCMCVCARMHICTCEYACWVLSSVQVTFFHILSHAQSFLTAPPLSLSISFSAASAPASMYASIDLYINIWFVCQCVTSPNNLCMYVCVFLYVYLCMYVCETYIHVYETKRNP